MPKPMILLLRQCLCRYRHLLAKAVKIILAIFIYIRKLFSPDECPAYECRALFSLAFRSDKFKNGECVV